MFGAHPALHHGALQASNSCAPVAVRMSGDSGTLAGRIANCTDANVRAHRWYDVIYMGHGMGWALDYGVFGEKVQQHFCLPKGFNVSTTERQIGSIRWNSSSAAASSDYVYRIESTATVGRNTADPGNDMRLQVVDNPYKPGSDCLLMRIREIDPTTSNARSALRCFGTDYGSGFANPTRESPNMRYMDRMPRWREQWFAGAYLFADSASFDQGETESWASAGSSTPEVCGWQLHLDDGTGSMITGTATGYQDPCTPNYSLWLVPSTGAESNTKFQIKRWRPAGPTKVDQSVEFISQAQSGVDGAMESPAQCLLWESTSVPLRTKWVGFVHRLIWSAGGDGLIQCWYNELDSYSAGATPTEIINESGRNDPNVGRHGVGYYCKSDGTTRRNPQNRRGDPYLCFEIYNPHNSSWNLPASVTIRCIPVRFHDRNPARSASEYASDLMTLLKAAAY
jgi:hypothetical protein